MANSQQSQLHEVIIDRDDYIPEFHWEQRTVTVGSGWYSRKTYRNVPAIYLTKDNGEVAYKLYAKAFGRLLGFCGIGRNNFVKSVRANQPDTQEWLEAIYSEQPCDKFMLLISDDQPQTVIRITSDDYVSVPHSLVQRVIEKRLDAEGIRYEKDIRFGGVNGIYTLPDVDTNAKGAYGAEIARSISYMNRNTGDKSLKIFGGAVVLVCSNGMTSNEAVSEMRILHKLDLKVVERKIEQELGAILEKIKFLPQEFLKLREIKVTDKEARAKIESLPIPKYLQEAIWTRLFTNSKETRNGIMDFDGTMWGLYMAATYIASHDIEVKKGRQTKKVNEDIAQQLQSVELFTTDWDAKEKELEKSGAPKMEAKK